MSLFKPAWWLSNPHAQTIFPSLFRKINRPLPIRRETLITKDNDFLDIDWCTITPEPNHQGKPKNLHPLVILIHGLTGSSQSSYIQGLQQLFLRKQIDTVAINFRGCSGRPNNLARGYHSGETGDIHFLYQTLRQRYPERPMFVIGFSLGANVLLKWLAEQGGKLSLNAAISICSPLVLAECANKLDSGFARLYRKRLIDDLVTYLEQKKHHLKTIGAVDEYRKLQALGELSTIQSFWQYDDRVVAKLHGFKDVHDYYQQSSSRQYLNNIQTNTLMIQALDDPFMTPKVLPEPSELSASTKLEITEKGGHVGFVSGYNPLQPNYWLEERISQFLAI